jgi:hypothetical protein
MSHILFILFYKQEALSSRCIKLNKNVFDPVWGRLFIDYQISSLGSVWSLLSLTV